MQAASPVALVIISVSFMLLFGFAMTRLTKLLRLPNVTAYILTGILLGPYCLDIVPQSVIDGTDFLSDISLALVAFGTGRFFHFSVLRRNGLKSLVITLFEALSASAAVFLVSFFLLRLQLPFAIVLSALAAATAPTSTMMTIRQTGSKGDFVDTLLQVVALDNILSLVAYSVALSVAASVLSRGAAVNPGSIIRPILTNLGALVLGGVFGLLMKLLMPQKRSTDNRLIISVALLFGFCGICALLDISPLLGCMSMGTVYFNIARDDKLFKQLNYFGPPILLLFFVRSGLNFNLGALGETVGSIGTTSLLVIGVLYFAVRMLAKYGGAFLGCRITKKDPKIGRYLGLALIPQAGVAIGLAALGARTLGGEAGMALNTVILSASILYELVGPPCAKLALFCTGSYSNKLEELAQVPDVTPDGKPRPAVELLIERIKAIQERIPPRDLHAQEDEAAFTEAAEQYESQTAIDPRRRRMARK